MAFIKELIQTDEQKAFFDSFGFRDYRGDVMLSRKKADKWFVDKENQMYLFCMGGGAFEIPLMYGIYIQSQGIIVIQSDTPQLDLIDKIIHQGNITLSAYEIKNIVVGALEDMGDEKVYGKFKNADILSIPNLTIMKSYEEDRYVPHN